SERGEPERDEFLGEQESANIGAEAEKGGEGEGRIADKAANEIQRQGKHEKNQHGGGKRKKITVKKGWQQEKPGDAKRTSEEASGRECGGGGEGDGGRAAHHWYPC